MKKLSIRALGTLLTALAFAGVTNTTASAQDVLVGGLWFDSNEMIFVSDDESIEDTRKIVSGKNLGHLYATKETGSLFNTPSSGGALTFNPEDPTDLWFVTCAHCVLKGNRFELHTHFEAHFIETGEVAKFTKADKVLVGNMTGGENDDIAIFDVRDDLKVRPLAMDPDFSGEVYVLASTNAFYKPLGSPLRVPTVSGGCKFWTEPGRIFHQTSEPERVATNCPASQGSSGSPLIGQRTDGTEVIVGVFNRLETTIIDDTALGGIAGKQRRRVFRKASLNLKRYP